MIISPGGNDSAGAILSFFKKYLSFVVPEWHRILNFYKFQLKLTLQKADK
jgi:hypothetical protein